MASESYAGSYRIAEFPALGVFSPGLTRGGVLSFLGVTLPCVWGFEPLRRWLAWDRWEPAVPKLPLLDALR